MISTTDSGCQYCHFQTSGYRYSGSYDTDLSEPQDTDGSGLLSTGIPVILYRVQGTPPILKLCANSANTMKEVSK